MQPADEEHGESPEREPGPARKIETALKPLDLLMQEQRGDAEGEAEQGHAAERDRHAHHALPPDRLEHEQAEDAVHEIEQPDHVLGRPEVIVRVAKNVVSEASSAMRKVGSPMRQPQITHRTR